MEWKFKKGVKVYTEEFWYGLTDGGYIKPENVLVDEEQFEKLQAAIDLVRSFERAIDDQSENQHSVQEDICPECGGVGRIPVRCLQCVSLIFLLA